MTFAQNLLYKLKSNGSDQSSLLHIIFFFFGMQDVTSDNKLRLLLIYAAIHGNKLENDKLKKLMEVPYSNMIISYSP